MGKKKPKSKILDLRVLASPPGLPALTVHAGGSLAEAAAVCLEHNGHDQGVHLKLSGKRKREFRLQWEAASVQTMRTHNDPQDATEDGACAVAIVVVMEVTGLTVIERAFKGGGFDYWLGESAESLFQNKSRLEVSGILKGDDSEVRSRVRKKSVQTEKSDSLKIPAFVCVVEFGRPQVSFVKR